MREGYNIHEKSNSLEHVLKEINSSIQEIRFKNEDKNIRNPIVLICGCARSGSTLMLQKLVSTDLFSYPSNLIARFYSNPGFGIKVQQALIEFDPINQMGFHSDNKFNSNLGKTFGALEPSEFWYYWRQFFSFGENQKLSAQAIDKVDMKGFLEGLNQFESLTGKPLVLKGMMLNWNLSDLFRASNKFVFVFLERDEFYNAQSLLKARENYFNDRNVWYSFKPPEYFELKDKSPLEQVAGQVVYTNKSIKEELKEIPKTNVIHVKYEEFCSFPDKFVNELCHKINALKSGQNQVLCELNKECLEEIKLQNKCDLTSEEVLVLKSFIEKYQSK
ncbi:MAG: sulfotransferase [Flavobacteriales bacterium]|nr:sulfotransferase [Flavobacteriales bacterium]